MRTFRNEARDDYLETILLIKRNKGYCRAINIANELNITKPEIKEFTYIENILDFIECLDKEKEKTIAFINKFFNKEAFERNNFQIILDEMLLLFYDILQKKVGLDIVYSNKYKDRIEKIAKENTYEELNNKILSINNAMEKMKVNANTKLIMDALILESNGGAINV